MIGHEELLAALDILVLERLSGRWFVPRGTLPSWCKAFGAATLSRDLPFAAPEVFPFFELFIADAERVWSGEGRPGEGTARLDSGGFTQMTEDGTELHFAATALAVEGKSLLVVVRSERIFREERAMLQRARELRFAHDALSREVEQKEVLAHCVVHDLRNPLSSILGALVLLSKQPLPAADAKLVEVALRAANRQDELIREILDVFLAESQAEATQRSDEKGAPRSGEGPQRADVTSVITQVVSVLAPRAKSRGVHLSASLELEADQGRVTADELRLFRVLGNLVQNALRYSPADASVRITASGDGEHEGFLHIAVEDDGPGVSPALLPRLFHKFARATDGTGGTGLGLYFCRITVERWGGSIGYEPRAGGGSKFWLRLPMWQAPASDRLPALH